MSPTRDQIQASISRLTAINADTAVISYAAHLTDEGDYRLSVRVQRADGTEYLRYVELDADGNVNAEGSIYR